VLALSLLGAGCLDPSIYGNYGRTPPPPQAPSRAKATPKPEAGGSQDDVFWADAKIPKVLAQSPNNVAIIVEKIESSALSATDASLGIRYASGKASVRAAGGALARRNGIRIGVASESLRARLRASVTRARSSSRQKMFITVLSGQEGTLLVGSDVYVERLGYWGPHGYRVLLERAFVGRSLAVRPRIARSGVVEIELWPRFTTRRGRVIDLTELATKVVARDRQPIVIGGMSTASNDAGSVLFGIGSRTRTGTMTMILTPQIGGMQIDWPTGKW
jgi:hypothetical protein